MTSDEPFTLDQMTHPRRRRPAIIVGACAGAALLVAATVVITLAAAGDRTATPAVPQHAVTSTGAVESPTSNNAQVIIADPAALDACGMANKVYSAPSGNLDLYTPAKTRPIGQRAIQSSNTEVKRWGTEIIEKADAADAAVGRDAKFQANLAAGGAVTQFLTYCTKQKFVTP